MKSVRNPIPTDEDYCIIEGSPYAQLHEVYFGPDKGLSQYYGLQVRLCLKHHTVGRISAHMDSAFNFLLKHVFQLNFNKWYPELDFKTIFGQNYILPDEIVDDYCFQLKWISDKILEQLKDSPTFGRYKGE